MFLRPSVKLLLVLALFLGVALGVPDRVFACGWGGDGGSDNTEAIVIGPDGKVQRGTEDPWSDPKVQLAIGDKSRLGKGAPIDYAKAMYWYGRAARKGLAAAQNNLATMYEQGLGAPKNLPEAAKWFRLAALQGENHAQHSLGVMYRDGQGMKRNYGEALNWFKMAAAGGHTSALVDLGDLFWKGLGVPKDPVRAYMWWDVATRRGEPRSAQLCRTAALEMSEDQVKEARLLAAAWRPETGSPTK